MKKLVLFCLAVIFAFNAQAQDDQATLEALKTELAAKKAAADAAAGEAAAVQAKIDALPGWRTGGLGILGFNLNNSSDWFANAIPNSSSRGLSFGLSGFANQIQPKYFWRNNGTLNLGAVRFEDTSIDYAEGEEPALQVTTDAIQVTSLYGYRLNDKIAISALGDFKTLFLGTRLQNDVPDSLATGFLNPGYLDIGAGITWTPIANLVAVFHPLNYNFVFANDAYNFQSSLGSKIVVDYTQSLPKGIAWKSNLSAFLSYKDVPELSNWQWTNGFSFTAFKGVGVSLEYALRNNKQEALNLGKNVDGSALTENKLQQYFIMGLSYSL